MKNIKQKKFKTNNTLLPTILIVLCLIPLNTYTKKDCFCQARRNNPCGCSDYVCALSKCNTCNYGRTFFHTRSQNTNTARRAVGNHLFRHAEGCNRYHTDLTITPEYSQSFKPFHIAEYFFAKDCLNFSGSMVETRQCNDILADYFGLSPEFRGSIQFEPQIKSFLLDFDFLAEFNRGIYLRIYTPLVHTKWGIGMCETVVESGKNTLFPAGYMSEQAVEAPITCISKALGGNITFGDVTEGIQYGKFSRCQRTTKLADFTALLGWIFLQRDRGYVGINIQATGPTGTRPNSKYIFEPVAGNGHHWELGIGFTGQILIWEKDEDQTLHFHGDANFSHLFTSCQRRSFDLKYCNSDRFASRYILTKEFDTDGAYTGRLTPLINVTTLNCDVKINFQMDINLMFAYNKGPWEFDFGYNGWLASHEKISLCEYVPEYRYGLKGIQNVSSVYQTITQHCATIYGNLLVDQAEVADDEYPTFIRNCDLDICSAETPKAITHKFYSHLSYSWEKEDRCATPYLGGGWQIEFESINPRYQCPYKNTLYQWALWLKFGIAYH